MCSICGFYTCPPGCPNAEEPPAVYVCDVCGEAIVVGDDFVELEDARIHRECFEDLNTDEVMEYVGGSLKTASEDDIDDRGDEAYEQYRDEMLERRYAGS